MYTKNSMIPIDETALSAVVGGRAAAEKVQIVSCCQFCKVRSSASSQTDANVIGKAATGDCYDFEGWEGNWARIRYGSHTGYVRKDYVTLFRSK